MSDTVKHRFELEDLRTLELFFLGPKSQEQPCGAFGVMNEDVADILDTFRWASSEGDCEICYIGYPEQDKLIAVFREICERLNVEYAILQHKDHIYLDLMPGSPHVADGEEWIEWRGTGLAGSDVAGISSLVLLP